MAARAPRREVNGITEKQCPDCAGWFAETLEHFYASAGCGLVAPCRPCWRIRVRKAKDKHKAQVALAKRPIVELDDPATSLDTLTRAHLKR